MELVPEKMPEEEFWLQFFQSQLFHRDSLPGANSKKNFFTDALVKEQKCEQNCIVLCVWSESCHHFH
jgi:hypothetical protein